MKEIRNVSEIRIDDHRMVNGKSPDTSYNSRTLGHKASKERTGHVQKMGNEVCTGFASLIGRQKAME